MGQLVSGLAETWRYAGLVARETWLRATRRGAIGRLTSVSLGGTSPNRLLVAPTDLHAADPIEADHILSGLISLADGVLETEGVSPFELDPPTEAFAEALLSFSWLRQLRARRDEETSLYARQMVLSFLRHHGRISGPAWETDVTARRLIAFLSHSTVILRGADTGFYRRFLKAIGRHEKHLRSEWRTMPIGETRLYTAIALAMASICVDLPETRRNAAARRLDFELECQILADGGHVSRNPQVLLRLLFELLPLRQTYINLNLPLPKRLVPAIDRIYPALRFFRHRDGDLALFNGATPTLATELSAILRYDESGGQPFRALPHTGFHRLEAGATVVIVDAGRPLSTELSKTAHAGATAFEMSAGSSRFIVNAGLPHFASAEIRSAVRATAAHSAVTLENTSSMRFSHSDFLGPVATSGVSLVDVARETDADGEDQLRMRHDGYLGRFGLFCRRSISLTQDGARITGRDSFTRKAGGPPPEGEQAIAIARFHIHPSIWITRESDDEILLTAPDSTSFLFAAPGLIADIEDDVFFASSAGPRPSRQIAVPFRLGISSEILWSFERQS